MKRLPVLLCAVVLLAATAAPVAAAAPGNDLPSGATPVLLPLPFSDVVDTTEATAVGDDYGCGAGGVDQASVWYTITVPEQTLVVIDASASTYFTGVNLFGEDPAAGPIDCAGVMLPAQLDAGLTYYVMIADADEDGVNGGTLSVTFQAAPPPPELTVAIDPVGKLDPKSGLITVSGTMTCSEDFDVETYAVVRQTVGRFTIHGGFWDVTGCTSGDEVPWTVTVSGENGKFSGGRATVEVSLFACGWFDCVDATATRTISLRR